MTSVQMLLSFIFSPDSRQVFACFLKTVAQLLYDIPMSGTNFLHHKFTKSLLRQVRDTVDTCTKVVRLSHDISVDSNGVGAHAHYCDASCLQKIVLD